MIGSMAGYCEKHKIEKMFVGLDTNTEPTCVRCVADSTPKLGSIQTAKDPGEHFFNKSVQAVPDEVHKAAVTPYIVSKVDTTLEAVVKMAVINLNALPMPKDIKQFKAVQKAIKTLESLVEKSNG